MQDTKKSTSQMRDTTSTLARTASTSPGPYLRRGPLPGADRLRAPGHGDDAQHRDQPAPPGRLDQHQAGHREDGPQPRPDPRPRLRPARSSRKEAITTPRLWRRPWVKFCRWFDAERPPEGRRAALSPQVAARHPLVFAKANLPLSLRPFVDTAALVRELFFTADTPQETVDACLARLQDESYPACLDTMLLALPRPRRVAAPVLVLGALVHI